jgi:hypothetical protein
MLNYFEMLKFIIKINFVSFPFGSTIATVP